MLYFWQIGLKRLNIGSRISVIREQRALKMLELILDEAKGYLGRSIKLFGVRLFLVKINSFHTLAFRRVGTLI